MTPQEPPKNVEVIKLEPEQVETFWDSLKPCIVKSLPPLGEKAEVAEQRILENLKANRWQCWIGSVDQEIVLVCCTSFAPGLTGQALMINTIFGTGSSGQLPDEVWAALIDTLKTWTKGIGAKDIIGLSKLPWVIAKARELGAATDYTMLKWSV